MYTCTHILWRLFSSNWWHFPSKNKKISGTIIPLIKNPSIISPCTLEQNLNCLVVCFLTCLFLSILIPVFCSCLYSSWYWSSFSSSSKPKSFLPQGFWTCWLLYLECFPHILPCAPSCCRVLSLQTSDLVKCLSSVSCSSELKSRKGVIRNSNQ